MKQFFIHRQNRPDLTLFMAGWGMDEHPFTDYHLDNNDLLVCYDYRTLEFDRTLLRDYRHVRLVAWSMGVWAAEQLFHDSGISFKECIAVNGTPHPVDDERGIPRPIFEGTLEKLNDVTLRKFLRRMCGSSGAFAEFLEHRPQRSVEELKEELACIGNMASRHSSACLAWDKAFIGKGDLIFPPQNQRNAWTSTGTSITESDVAHYDREWLKTIVCNTTTGL